MNQCPQPMRKKTSASGSVRESGIAYSSECAVWWAMVSGVIVRRCARQTIEPMGNMGRVWNWKSLKVTKTLRIRHAVFKLGVHKSLWAKYSHDKLKNID